MSRSTDRYFLRAGKLVRKPRSNWLIPRADGANAPPFLPLAPIPPVVHENADDSWWPMEQARSAAFVLATAAAALAASVAVTNNFNRHNDEIVPQPPPQTGGSITPTVRNAGPNFIRWWQDDELPSGAAPAFVGDEEGWTPPAPQPPAPQLLAAQHQDEPPPQAATLADDAPDWFPGSAIVQRPVVRLWDHQDERAPTLLEENQWPDVQVVLRADPLAILWATDEDAIQASGMEEEPWPPPAPLAPWFARALPGWQDELGTAAAALAPSEDDWRAPAPLAALLVGMPAADDDFAPPRFALDDDGWTAPAPQRWAAAVAAFWADEDYVPQAGTPSAFEDDGWAPPAPAPAAARALPDVDPDWAPPAVVDDDAGWQAPRPASAATAAPQWPDDAFSTVVLADDAWQAAPPLAPAVAGVPVWDDGAAVQQPVALADEEYEFRSLVLPAWVDARVWAQQDEWPTPLTPLPFDEDPWITFPPVLVAPKPAYTSAWPIDEDAVDLVAPPVPPPAPVVTIGSAEDPTDNSAETLIESWMQRIKDFGKADQIQRDNESLIAAIVALVASGALDE